MKVMRFAPSLALLVILCGVLAVGSLAAFETPHVSASAVETSGTVNDGVAQATFKIAVTNSEASAMTNFNVIFQDDSIVSIGDVDAGTTVVSDSVTRTVNLSDMASRNWPVKVTLQFALDGATHEVPWNLTLGRQ